MNKMYKRNIRYVGSRQVYIFEDSRMYEWKQTIYLKVPDIYFIHFTFHYFIFHYFNSLLYFIICFYDARLNGIHHDFICSTGFCFIVLVTYTLEDGLEVIRN